MSKGEDVSLAVVVPLLNELRTLPALLDMLSALPVDEVVLVDGGSSDGTLQILQRSGFQVLQTAAGRALQMNVGAEASVSDIIIFLHADTKISSSEITAIKNAFHDPSVSSGRFDLQFSSEAFLLRVIAWFINQRSRWSGIHTGDQCMFVRRATFEAVGGFPEQPLMEDVELAKRLKRMGRVTALHERVVTSSRRWEQHGVPGTVLLMWKLRLFYWLGASPERLAAMYQDAR